MREFLWKNKKLVLLLIVLAIAMFFRLWQLSSIPPGLYPDVAMNGNNAIETLKSGNFKVFYPENNGREGLFMWLIASSFLIFGVSIWSIKIVAAIIGTLTVFGLYLLTRELFNQSEKDSQAIALLSSFFLATSFWHTNFSRIGFRAILVPFILVFGFYFLFRGFKTKGGSEAEVLLPPKKIYNFIISGIFFGLGFYTYISYRFIVLLLPLILICWWLIYHKEKRNKEFLRFTVCCLLFTIIVALPIGIYFIKNPQDFVGRAAPISIFAAENPVKELGKSLVVHLGMFNFYGDPNWRHNFSKSPMLFFPIGILFLIGFFFSVKELIASIKNKNWSLVIGYWTLISWFFIMLLPGILTYEGIPHSLRVIGVIPVVYIFVGFGGWKIYNLIEKNTKRKRLLLAAVFLFLLAVSFFEFDKYFFDWGKNKEVESAFTKRFSDIGYFLNSLPKDIQKYVIVNEPGVPVPFPNGIPVSAQTIMFIENMKYGSLQSIYLLPKDLDQIKIEKETVIVPMKVDKELFIEFSHKFPQGKIKKENEIFIYEIR